MYTEEAKCPKNQRSFKSLYNVTVNTDYEMINKVNGFST